VCSRVELGGPGAARVDHPSRADRGDGRRRGQALAPLMAHPSSGCTKEPSPVTACRAGARRAVPCDGVLALAFHTLLSFQGTSRIAPRRLVRGSRGMSAARAAATVPRAVRARQTGATRPIVLLDGAGSAIVATRHTEAPPRTRMFRASRRPPQASGRMSLVCGDLLSSVPAPLTPSGERGPGRAGLRAFRFLAAARR
jgi:hypothetical protein